jgi:hypothetical protein
MTLRVSTATGAHSDALTGHTYAIPVVRELPIPPAARLGDHTW